VKSELHVFRCSNFNTKNRPHKNTEILVSLTFRKTVMNNHPSFLTVTVNSLYVRVFEKGSNSGGRRWEVSHWNSVARTVSGTPF
jgi:hypothetical protein